MSFSEWKKVKLGDLLNFRRGHDLPKTSMLDGKIPVVGSNGVIGFHNIFTTKAPCLTIGRSGNIGNPCFINEDCWAHNTTLYVENFKNNVPKYIYYLLKTLDLGYYGGGSAVPTLNRNHIHPLMVRATENLSEQKAIADTLSCLDDKIELNNRINKTLEEMAQAIFKCWFVDFEPFQNGEFEDSELGRIPKGWRAVELAEICKCVLGGTPSRKIKSYWNGHIPWVNSGKVNDYRIIEASEYITELGLKKSATTLLPAKTVVLAITGATLGQVSLLEISSCANQSVVGILENDNIPYEYIYPMICSHVENIINSQTGGAQQHINKGNVEKEKLIIPGLKVLLDYKNTVKSIYDSIAKNCFENKILKEIRDSLLPKLMSGEIRVPTEEVK